MAEIPLCLAFCLIFSIGFSYVIDKGREKSFSRETNEGILQMGIKNEKAKKNNNK